MKGELLAKEKSMERWKHIFKYWSLFSLYRHVQSLKSEESIFQHWLAELAQYEFIVIYKKIVENIDVKPNI